MNLAKHLTDYVIQKGMINNEQRELYEYGFTLALELGSFLMFCLVTAIHMHMLAEGLFFFAVFSPLRSYAGGLHLKKFRSCFLLSCLTFSGILLAVKHLYLPTFILFVFLLGFLFFVYFLYPVENINRPVDTVENQYFKKRLLKFLYLDFFIGVLCILTKQTNFLFELVTILFIIVITMLLGKHTQRK